MKNYSDAELGSAMEYFAERLNRVFSYFFFVIEYTDDEDLKGDPSDSGRVWMLKTMQNACMEMTLIAIRDLEDVLSERRGCQRESDFKAVDLGYPRPASFLTKAERDGINETIAHTTTKGPAAVGWKWEMWDLATRAISQSLDFLNWFEGHYGISYYHAYTAALLCRTQTEKIQSVLASEFDRRRSNVP
jgi:hypothetical protein